MKKCCNCKLEKDFSNFYKNKSKKDGFNSVCILCSKEYNIKNKEKITNKKREWFENNKEKIIKQKKNGLKIIKK